MFVYFGSFVVMLLDKEEDFGLIRPSLIKQLKSILDQYPDNGQILKVSKQFSKFNTASASNCLLFVLLVSAVELK